MPITSSIDSSLESQPSKTAMNLNDAIVNVVQSQFKEQNMARALVTSKIQSPMSSVELPDLQIVGARNSGDGTAAKASGGSLGGDAGNVVRMAGNLTTDVGQTLESSWLDFKIGVSTVQKMLPQIEKGGLDELENHKLAVAENFAAGAAIGVGLSFLGPEATLALGLAGAAYAGYKLAQNIPGIVHDADVVANPQQFSKGDLADADKGLQTIGAVAVEVKAGMFGGLAGGLAVGAARGLLGEQIAGAANTLSPKLASTLTSEISGATLLLADCRK